MTVKKDQLYTYEKPIELKPPSKFLPGEARDLLISSTRVPNPLDRLAAIDAAIDYVKVRFPAYFKQPPKVSNQNGNR